jgi:hypothetical protein
MDPRGRFVGERSVPLTDLDNAPTGLINPFSIGRPATLRGTDRVVDEDPDATMVIVRGAPADDGSTEAVPSHADREEPETTELHVDTGAAAATETEESERSGPNAFIGAAATSDVEAENLAARLRTMRTGSETKDFPRPPIIAKVLPRRGEGPAGEGDLHTDTRVRSEAEKQIGVRVETMSIDELYELHRGYPPPDLIELIETCREEGRFDVDGWLGYAVRARLGLPTGQLRDFSIWPEKASPDALLQATQRAAASRLLRPGSRNEQAARPDNLNRSRPTPPPAQSPPANIPRASWGDAWGTPHEGTRGGSGR